jgi:hypothetical protein
MNKLKQFLIPAYIEIYKFYTLYINPYQYKKEPYLDSFISKEDKAINISLDNAKEVIYIFWTGTNEIPGNRRKGIQSLKDRAGVEIVVVTPNNLNDYILEDYPLHSAYQYLSYVHRADYLRCYFMLHRGGGYADIKPCLVAWKKYFVQINNNPKIWSLGVREKYSGGVPNIDGRIGEDIKKYHNILIGNGAYIFKPNSPIAKEWMQELHCRLDMLKHELIKCPGDAFGENKGYPIEWSFILAQIFHPLILKYHEKVIRLDLELFSIEDYR